MSVFCWVKETKDKVSKIINSGQIANAWLRQRCLELQNLLEDVSCGRGTIQHLSLMTDLAETMLAEKADRAGREIGQLVSSALKDHQEVFRSHIETRICPTGGCIKLAPAPCQMACPAGVDVPGYLWLIGQGRDAEAISLIREDNPLPLVCGFVCTNPCELKCARGCIDDAVSIRSLKRFAAERTLDQGGYQNPEKAPDTGQSVCIVGAGPAGLAGAYYLALKGYRVTVIESLPVAGGMMRVGIPRYRLPEEVIEREVAFIRDLGVEFCFNTRFGQDVTFDGLRKQGMSAFLLAPGAHAAFELGISGEKDCPQVLAAIDFLRDVALGKAPMIGKKVAVIGGGNVAIDAARSAVRLGCDDVTVVYRRTLDQMPASEEEINQAREEGVCFSFLSAPLSIEHCNGKLLGLKCLRTRMGQLDKSGRSRPIPIENSEFMVPADTILPAVGQKVIAEDLNFLGKQCWTAKNTIMVDAANMATGVEGVFAAGDVATGPTTVIQAIAGGKRASESIHRYLSGRPLRQAAPLPIRRSDFKCMEIEAETKTALRRPHLPMINMEQRKTGFQLVEMSCPEKQAREEVLRCLRCDICARCGTCVEICRDQIGVDALSLGYMNFEKPGPTNLMVASERCIGCGACVANCPTGAMTMEDRGKERVLLFCGTILNRLTLRCCQKCGDAIAPGRYLDLMAERAGEQIGEPIDQVLCPSCAAKSFAEQIAC